MAEKVTTMVLKVDLQCPCCYKKVKKTLCKIPQIRNQVYDEKGNTVTVTVVCCSPEKIRDKLCCKGGKAIKSIAIKDASGDKPKPPKEGDKPKAAEKPKEAEKPKDKPKEAEKPKDKPKEAEKPKEDEKPKDKPKEADKPKDKPKEADKPKEDEKPKEGDKPKESKPDGQKAANPVPNPNPPMMFQSVPVNGFPMVYPGQAHFDGHYGVPAYHGFGIPPPPQPRYDGYYGGGYEHGRVTHVNRPDYYFSEENPQGCSIM